MNCLALSNHSLAAGCGDGTVRMFDTREQHIDRYKTELLDFGPDSFSLLNSFNFDYYQENFSKYKQYPKMCYLLLNAMKMNFCMIYHRRNTLDEFSFNRLENNLVEILNFKNFNNIKVCFAWRYTSNSDISYC